MTTQFTILNGQNMTNDKKITVKEVGMKKSLPKKEVLMMLEKTAEVAYDAGKQYMLDKFRKDIENIIAKEEILDKLSARREKLSFWIGFLSAVLGFMVGRLIFILFF